MVIDSNRFLADLTPLEGTHVSVHGHHGPLSGGLLEQVTSEGLHLRDTRTGQARHIGIGDVGSVYHPDRGAWWSDPASRTFEDHLRSARRSLDNNDHVRAREYLRQADHVRRQGLPKQVVRKRKTQHKQLWQSAVRPRTTDGHPLIQIERSSEAVRIYGLGHRHAQLPEHFQTLARQPPALLESPEQHALILNSQWLPQTQERRLQSLIDGLTRQGVAHELVHAPSVRPDEDPTRQDHPLAQEGSSVPPTTELPPNQRAENAVERIGRHPRNSSTNPHWDELNRALDDLNATGQHQRVLELVHQVRESNPYQWWHWEQARSRAAAALDPQILSDPVVIHHTHLPGNKGRTRVYGVEHYQDEGLTTVLAEDMKATHSRREGRWSLRENTLHTTHNKRLRHLISYMERNSIPYLAQEVRDELSSGRRSETDTATPTSAPEPSPSEGQALKAPQHHSGVGEQALSRLELDTGATARKDLSQVLSSLLDQGHHDQVLGLVRRANEIDPHGWWERAEAASTARFTHAPEDLASALRLSYDGHQTIKVRGTTPGPGDADIRQLIKRDYGGDWIRAEQAWQLKSNSGDASSYREKIRDLSRDIENLGRTWIVEDVHADLQKRHRSQMEEIAAQAPPVAEVNGHGHVGQLADILTYPVLEVQGVYRHQRQGEYLDSWTIAYRSSDGHSLTRYTDQAPTVRAGQWLRDAKVKIHDHAFTTRGQARTVIIPVPDQPPKKFALTGEQESIRQAALDGQKMVVQAGAGTGKTSTLMEVAQALGEQGKRGAYVVYGRANANEATTKLAHVPVITNTLHAFAMRAVGTRYRKRLNGDRQPDWNTVAQRLGLEDVTLPQHGILWGSDLARLTDQAIRQFELSADTELSASHIPHLPGLSSQDHQQVQRLLEPALGVAWQDLTNPEGNLLRFKHDTYVKIWHLSGQAHIPGDYLMAEDMNRVAEAILQQQTHMQQIWVGDSAQAVHGWRGAIDALGNQNPDTELTLTQSFRFGPGAAGEANKWLEVIDAPLRVTGTPDLNTQVHDSIDAPDAVLTRTNAGAFAAGMQQLGQGRTVALVGGTAELERLVQAAEKLQAGERTDHPDLSHFRNWNQVRLCAQDRPEDLDGLAPFVRLVEDEGINRVREGLSRMSSPDPQVEVSTAHKAKGLEWDRVQIGEDFTPETDGEGNLKPISVEEAQLAYVAITRARHDVGRGSLSYIDDYAAQPPTRQETQAQKDASTSAENSAQTQDTPPSPEETEAARASEAEEPPTKEEPMPPRQNQPAPDQLAIPEAAEDSVEEHGRDQAWQESMADLADRETPDEDGGDLGKPSEYVNEYAEMRSSLTGSEDQISGGSAEVELGNGEDADDRREEEGQEEQGQTQQPRRVIAELGDGEDHDQNQNTTEPTDPEASDRVQASSKPDDNVEVIDGHAIRAKDRQWINTLHKHGRAAALSRSDPRTYDTMLKDMTKAMSNGKDVRLKLPSNDLEAVKRFIAAAREHNYEVTVSARISPTLLRKTSMLSSLNDHLHKGTIDQAVTPQEHGQQLTEQRRILDQVQQEKLADRIELLPRNSDTPLGGNHLVSDSQGQAVWAKKDNILNEVKKLAGAQLSPEEERSAAQQLNQIRERLPDPGDLKESEVSARDYLETQVEEVRQTMGAPTLAPDARARTTIDTPGPEPTPQEGARPAEGQQNQDRPSGAPNSEPATQGQKSGHEPSEAVSEGAPSQQQPKRRAVPKTPEKVAQPATAHRKAAAPAVAAST